MLRRSVLFLQSAFPKSAWMKPKSTPQPIIRRSRSWRGIMQVRYDDSKSDRGKIVRQIVFWSPLRVFGITFVSLSIFYFLTGHDSFMMMLFGYESENSLEERVNRAPANTPRPLLLMNKGFNSPVRQMETPLYGERKFENLVKPSS